MNNKVSNPKIEVPKTKEMNDYDFLITLLEAEKNMSNNLSSALNEVSCDKLFNFEFTLFTEVKGLARDLFDVMFEYGWYSLEKAEQIKIDTAITKLDQKLKELI